MNGQRLLMISSEDNVATALDNIKAGTEAAVRSGRETSYLKALEEIPFGFKMACEDIARGSAVIKYGSPIGIASVPIRKGELVHVHNLRGVRAGTGQAESERK